MSATAFLRPTSAWVALPLAATIGLIYAIALLGPGVAAGTSDFWLLPAGLSGGLVDIKVALSGYYWAVQDNWRWPLLHAMQPDPPDGLNLFLLDPVPILALTGKTIRSLTGVVVNLFPVWVTATFALNSLALAALVRAFGQRSVLAAMLAGGMGALAPVIHNRFGHVGHSAHWEFILALALCVGRPKNMTLAAMAILGLCILAAATNLYLYVMTAAIAAAFFVQAAFDRAMPIIWSIAGTIAVPASGLLLLTAFGVFGSASLAAETIPFGRDSMNLLAPFWPQTSGIFAWTGLYLLTRGSIGATPGQYEGYCYLGIGALILCAVALIAHRRSLPALIRRNWVLALALLTLSAWALSNTIYLGPVRIVSYPLPTWLLSTVLAWFRSEGRMFWPVAWFLVGLGIAGTLSVLPPRWALVVSAIVLSLQWIDVAPWRGRIHDLVEGPPVSVFGSLTDALVVETMIARHHRVVLVPSFDCNENGGGDYGAASTIAAAEVQLFAARTNAEMPSVSAARGAPDCARARDTPLRDLVGSGVLIALAQPGNLDRLAETRNTLDCQNLRVGLICTAPAEK